MIGYVPIKNETLTEWANEMRRISGETDALSPAQMIEMLKEYGEVVLPPGGAIYYIGIAESTIGQSSIQIQSSAG